MICPATPIIWQGAYLIDVFIIHDNQAAYRRSGFNQRLAGVNQRHMSPYLGDLAEWLCKAFASLVEWLCKAARRVGLKPDLQG